MSSPTKEGWMTKQGGMIKSWKRRWFSLVGTNLFYSEKQGKKELGTINLKEVTDVSDAPESKKSCAFKLVVPNVRTYIIAADNDKDKQDWMAAIKNAIGSSNSSVPAPASKPSGGDKQPALSLDDFALIRVLGRGTYGKVTLVRSKRDGKVYAMKSMSKKQLEESDQVQQTIQERDVLLKTRYPFLVCAYWSFQKPEKIFMVLDYVPGGELFKRLKEEGQFSEKRTQLYAAEILLGLGFLHKLDFVYRDLKPENILVDRDGHLKITDFGLVKQNMKAGSTTSTFCGTSEYIAPEMLQQNPYTKSVDWWSFGILVFEMLTGLPPFFDDNVNKMYRMIVTQDVDFPAYISPVAKDLISKLLTKDPEKRLGNGPSDSEEIKAHPFFDGLNWDDVINKRIKPEWQPEIKNDTDTGNFDPEFTNENAIVSYEDASIIDQHTQAEFTGFTCVGDNETILG